MTQAKKTFFYLRWRRASPASLTALLLAALLLLCAGALSVPTVAAEDDSVAVVVPAGRELCFFERAGAAGVKLYMRYVVLSGGALDIGVLIRDPSQNLVYKNEPNTEDHIIFKARAPGTYSFCLQNTMSTITEKVVAFTLLAGTPAKVGDSDMLSRAVTRVYQGLRDIRARQGDMAARYNEHRDTVEVANTRVVVWTLVQVIAIVGMGIANVWLARHMFRKRRMV